MKEYKELRLGELSVEQKLGLTMIAYLSDENESFNFAMELVKKHALGGICSLRRAWPGDPGRRAGAFLPL